MTNQLHKAICIFGCAGMMVGCAFDDEGAVAAEAQAEGEQFEAALTSSAQRGRVATVYEVAARKGISNGAALAGISISETGLAHCWKEATWACKGPESSSCGDGSPGSTGPVIAGSGDGACRIEQGGLGMFQFDAGTHAQTLAKYGNWVVTLDGNISHAAHYVADIVADEVAGISTREEGMAWINRIDMRKGSASLEKYADILACRYNGCCKLSATTCKTRRNAYRDNVLKAKTMAPD